MFAVMTGATCTMEVNDSQTERTHDKCCVVVSQFCFTFHKINSQDVLLSMNIRLTFPRMELYMYMYTVAAAVHLIGGLYGVIKL